MSKLVAGREKDFEFVSAMAQHGLIESSALMERISTTELQPTLREAVLARARAALGH